MCLRSSLFYIFVAITIATVVGECGPRLKYTWGDALQGTDCPGPDGTPYPRLILGLNNKFVTFAFNRFNRSHTGQNAFPPVESDPRVITLRIDT
ncbi:unnamed protein product [Colias eurytheme]|nr:unnamed protein product [Colias eurytheme]